jgi:hypothetical protein
MNKVVYVAVGEKYRKEAELSLKSLKQHNTVKVCLVTDSRPESGFWDEVIVLDNPSFSIRDKLKMQLCEADKCIFIDSDTYLADNIEDVFELLDRFEVVARQDGVRRFYKMENVPDSFPELNTGVLAFRKNDRVLDFFKLWEHYFNLYEPEMGREMDQRSFRKAAFESDIKLFVLPMEYNLMNITIGAASVKVKVLHGRPFEQLVEMEKEINKKTMIDRVFIPEVGVIYTVPEITLPGYSKLILNFLNLSVSEAFKRLKKKLK